MPIAELHGKVPSEVRALEDTLTSGAFGLLTVLPPACLARWLRQARRLDGSQLDVPGPDRVDARFWPQCQDASGGTCEPDVLLTISDARGMSGILVEVKYRSDMSGWPSVAEDPGVRSQLGREWFALQATSTSEFPGVPTILDRRILLYVTAGATVPRETLRIVAAELEQKTGDSAPFFANTYWLSWFSLANAVRDSLGEPDVRDHEKVALSRLIDLLRARRLLAFEGLPPPRTLTQVQWSYAHGGANQTHALPVTTPVPGSTVEVGRSEMSEATVTVWQALFDEYHRVVKGAGEILRDADRLMAQRGYKSANPQNTAGAEGSLHMDSPEKWVGGWFVRFYKSDAQPACFPYVAVFLHDRGGNDDFVGKGRLSEPLVIGGVIRSASDTPCGWSYWNAKSWFWSGGTPDGPPVVSPARAGNKEGQASNDSFAVRIERLHGLADLEQIVIEPLVELIG